MNNNFRNDYELIYLIKENDDVALDEIIRKYKGLMIRFTYQYRNMFQDDFDSRELFQVTLLSLYHAVMTYSEEHDCQFITYLKVIMERDILLYARSLKKNLNRANINTVSLNQLVNEEDGVYLLDMVENNQKSYNPVDYVNGKEDKRRINEVLYEVGEESAKVMLLWMEGYTYREIGEKLGLTLKQVEYIVRKSKKKLKGLIDYE